MSKYYWIITDVGNGLGLDEDVGTSSHDSKKNWESRPHQQFKMYDIINQHNISGIIKCVDAIIGCIVLYCYQS